MQTTPSRFTACLFTDAALVHPLLTRQRCSTRRRAASGPLARGYPTKPPDQPLLRHTVPPPGVRACVLRACVMRACGVCEGVC